MQSHQDKPLLNYATPQPEPLKRWFLRRTIYFILSLIAVFGTIGIIGRILVKLGLLDFLAQG